MSHPLRLAALSSAAVLSLVVAGPASAADLVAQAEASAVTLVVGGEEQSSGTVRATHDGGSETVTGEAGPPASVLQGQDVANFGVLAQEATAGVQDGQGVSAACAGAAGDGGSVVEIGESGCLTPGTNVSATLGSLDLSDLTLTDPEEALAPLDALSTATDPLQDPLSEVVGQVADQLGDLGLVATFGAVEGVCSADAGGADGDAILTDATVTLQGGPADDLVLATLPTHPDVNQKVVSDLSGFTDVILAGVRANFETALDGDLAPLAVLTTEVQDQVLANITDQLRPQLDPLQENVLDITLNAQSAPEDDALAVRALDVSLLPAASDLGAPTLLDLAIGDVECGPNDVVAAPQPMKPRPQPQPKSTGRLPLIPTTVSAGEPGTGSSTPLRAGLGALTGAAALGGLLVRRRA